MRGVALLALVSCAAMAQSRLFDPRFQRFNSRGEPGRTDRGFDDQGFAFFEAFPANGAGTSGACSTTPPTGAKGETATVTRSGTATCTKTATGGYSTSGIAVGDLVTLSSNVLRQEFDSQGVLGARIETTYTEDALRTEELDNAFWTSTATVTANAATPPNSTSQVSNAEQLSDASGAAFQGSCQAIASTSATLHHVFVHVRGATATAAQITMTGTGSSTGDCSATVTGLSGTTWNVLHCTSPAAYAGTLTSLTLCVNVGSVVGDTGTIMAWGFNHYAGVPQTPYRVSYSPAVASATAKNAELLSLPYVQTSPTTGSFAVSVQLPGGTSNNAGLLSQEAATVFKQALISLPAAQTNIYNGGVLKASAVTSAAGQHRIAGWFTGASTNVVWNGATTSGSAGTPATVDTLRIGNYSNSFVQDGIYSRACADPSDTRCR